MGCLKCCKWQRGFKEEHLGDREPVGDGVHEMRVQLVGQQFGPIEELARTITNKPKDRVSGKSVVTGL